MIGHLCYMKPLANEMPRSDNVLFVFYDFETTQDTSFTDSATEHVPNLVCVQQCCSQCETCVYIDEDYECCRKRKHSYFKDPVSDLVTHLYEPRGWYDLVVAIAHNARSYVAQCILKRAILLKWKPELNLNGSKIICMRMEHLQFIDSISYLPMPLRKLPEAFLLSVRKSWYRIASIRVRI